MNEYELTTDGVQLLGGRTWQDADHLNVRTDQGTVNYHAEAKCAAVPAPVECTPMMQSAAQSIGADFIPWGALGIDPSSCVEWVQFSRANYHYGEHGEDALCLTVPDPDPPVVPPVDEPEEPEKPVVPPLDCPEGKVPGWLDENGNPQGCVDDNPTPLQPKDELPVVTPPAAVETAAEVGVQQPQQLAETGVADGLGLVLGIVLVGAGLAATLYGKLGMRRS